MELEFIIAGCLGALVPDLLRFRKGLPSGVLSTRNYWIQLLVQVLLGAIAAHFLKDKNPTLQEALLLGFTAPEVFTRLAARPAAQPPTDQPTTGGPPIGGTSAFQTRAWWSR